MSKLDIFFNVIIIVMVFLTMPVLIYNLKQMFKQIKKDKEEDKKNDN